MGIGNVSSTEWTKKVGLSPSVWLDH